MGEMGCPIDIARALEDRIWLDYLRLGRLGAATKGWPLGAGAPQGSRGPPRAKNGRVFGFTDVN